MELLLTILLAFSSVILCVASVEYYYPPVFWQKDNCPFRQLQLQQMNEESVPKELFIKVLPYTGMNIVCPNDVSMNTWGTRSSPFFLTLYENLWHVNKEGYDKCEVNKDGKLLLVCDNPEKTKRLEFKFHPIYSIEEPRFIPGKHYYFITTSRGEKDELTSRRKSGADGHCEQYHMKLHIYVCNPKVEDCIWEMPRCDPPAELQQRMLMIDGKLPGPTRSMPATRPKVKTRKPTKQTVKTTTKEQPSALAEQITEVQDCKDKSETSINLVMNFVLGGVIVFLIAIIIILSCALTKRSKQYNLENGKLPEPNKQTRIYESIPVQLPPVSMVPIGSPQADYLVYARACTPDPQQHTLIRTPQHNYETPVFKFPDIPQRSRAGSTQVKSIIERQGDNLDSVSI